MAPVVTEDADPAAAAVVAGPLEGEETLTQAQAGVGGTTNLPPPSKCADCGSCSLRWS